MSQASSRATTKKGNPGIGRGSVFIQGRSFSWAWPARPEAPSASCGWGGNFPRVWAPCLLARPLPVWAAPLPAQGAKPGPVWRPELAARRGPARPQEPLLRQGLPARSRSHVPLQALAPKTCADDDGDVFWARLPAGHPQPPLHHPHRLPLERPRPFPV
jgi:hypothetical protein